MAEKNWLDEQSTVVPAAGGSDTSWLDGSSKVVSDATEEPSLLRSVGDSAIAFGSGVTQGIGMLANVAGADNPVSRGLDSATKALTDLESPYRKAEKQARAQKIADAEKSGSLLNEVGAYAGSFAEAPIYTTLNALGTSLPTLAAGFLPGGQAALAARAAQLGLGAAQGVGAVKGQIYDEVEKAWKDKGASPENAAARAAQAQSYTGDNAGMILAGGALGAAAGSTGAEGAVRRLVGREVAKDAAESSILKSAGMGALKESPMEMLQGGQERLASNIALQNEGFDQPTWQGVAGQAALEGLASAPMGAGFGALEVTARAPAQTAPDTPPAQPTVQPPVAGPTLALAGPDRGVIQVAGDGTARTPAYQAPGYVGDVTDVEAKTPRAQAADFASILDTDNVYSGWSNVQDGSDRATMRDQMDYVGRTYGGKTTPENAAEVAADLHQQFKWFRAASPEQKRTAINALMVPVAPIDPVREQVAAAAEQGGALSSAALTAIDTGLSDAMQPAPEQAPPQISLEEADARDRAAYEQFFTGFDADPVVSRYFENDDDIPDFDAASNASEEDFLRALGATEEDIQDAIATSSQSAIPQSSVAGNAGPQAYEPAGPREGAGEGAASQTGQVNAGAIQQAAPDAPVPGVGGTVGADGAGSAAAAVSGASGPGGAGTGAATGSGAGATEAGIARAGGRGDGNQALSAPTNLRDALVRVRQQKQEAANAQAAQAPAPAAAPVPGPAAATAVEAAGPALNIKDITAKQIPDMTDAELQVAIAHYGPAHKRTAKLQKEAQRRAVPATTTPTTTQGNTDGPQAAQTQQASPQPTQAAAAPAAAAGLTDGAPTANTGAQAAPAPGPQAAAPAESRQQRTQRIAAAGEAWTRMPTVEREAMAGRADGLNPMQRKNVPRAAWADLSADIRRKLADVMGTSVNTAQGAINTEAPQATAPVGDEQQFAPETGTLGIPRAEMPQIPSQSHGGLVKHLNAQGIAHETTMVEAAELKPTQAEYSPAKVEAAKTAAGDRAVIVSSDGHIIDGHHQALAAAEEGKPVKAIVLDAPVEQALEAVKNSPSAQSSTPVDAEPEQSPQDTQLWSRVPVPAADSGESAPSAEPGNEAGSRSTVESSQSDVPSVSPPTADAQPGAAKQPALEPKGPIQDFGQKIGGARKDVWSGFKDDLNSVGDDDIAGQPLAKVWPAPDYQKLIDAGMNAKAVAAVRALRDEVPAKPRAAWKVKRWAEQVKTLRSLANDVMDGKITVQDMERMGANKGAGLRGMMGRIELYELVGHGKSLEGVRFGLHHYTLYRGRENVDLWVVEKDSGASTFSNWPTEIATGDTKEQALAAFKEKYDSLDLQKAVRKASFDIFSERTSDGFFIGKKIGRNYAKLEGPFKTVKEAREYRQNNLPALETKLEKYKEIPRERADVNQPRVGVDMRNGQDVTPQMFSDVFGFRGVEFGNWVEQKRRQKDLNDAFDALMDMAAVLDIPTKAISLNGELGLAFGARGSGGVNPAAAHYEPDSVVINLTKKEGAGSLGHEWWHALDNYFAKQRKVNRGSFMTTGTDVGLAARGKDYFYEGGIRQEMIDAFGAVVKAINQTAMKARASKLDSKRTKEYWTTGEEMSARAFESYLISKLQDQNASNDYLANVVSEKTWDAMAALGLENDGSYPYPTAAEIPAIRAGFDHFFQTVETRADDAGNVAMFSRVPPGLTAEEAVAMFNAANQVSPDARSAVRRLSDERLVATQQLIDGIKEKWARAPEIIVARNMEDRQVPQEARDYDNKLRSQGSDGEARGFIYEGKVYLLSDELSGPAQIAEVLFHEVLGHYGLRGAFGDGLKPILQQIGTMRRRDVLAKAREYGMVAKGLSDADTWAAMSERDRLSAAEEVLAEMAQSTPEIGFVQRAIAAIRNWLRANVPGFKNLALTDDEIVRSYIIPARGFVNRSSETPQQALERAQMAFSRGGFADQTQTEAFKRWYGDWQNTSDVPKQMEPNRDGAQASRNGGAAPIDGIQREAGVDQDAARADGARRFTFSGASGPTGADGAPVRLYHGTKDDIAAFDLAHPRRKDKGWLGNGVYLTSNLEDANQYARAKRGDAGPNLMPLYANVRNPYEATMAEKARLKGASPQEITAFTDGLKAKGHDGVVLWDDSGHMELVAFNAADVKSAIGNNGNFDPEDDRINFSRAGMADDVAKRVGAAVKSVTVTNIKERAGFKLTDYLGIGLQALGRRQIVDIYGDLVPLAEYNRLVQQMEADKNEGGAEADQLVTRWSKLPDEKKLADLMHDATLAQIDPAKPYVDGDDKARYMQLKGQYGTLSDEAKKVYTDTRDAYQGHHNKVRNAIKERIERSELKGERKRALLQQMDGEFFKAVKGVYFPLARFGQYAVTVKGPDGKVESVSRAETKAEAEALRSSLLSAFPRGNGFTVGRVMLSKDFIADRDAVGRGFMTELYQVLDKQDMDAVQRAELEDTLGQLYLSSLPDLSWAKHGIHRKGTPGFSQDARRAFAQNMFHGARYLAKLRYSDLMQDELAAMQKHVDDWREVEGFDQNSAQRVVDEMNKRHESLMNPKSNALSTALTSFGFIFHLGLSPASAMVNLSQTALVAYPIMGAKWGFNKAGAALLKASQQAARGKNDITASLNGDELAAYNEAVRAGTIDVTMAHDLAGIAQGEDAGVMWKIRPVMRWASFLFHHAERFNRQVTFVAAYRLAREAGADHKAAFEQATKATYDGHFDYGAANRPRIMQGNVAKVLLLFKQYGQNMVYTLARNAQQAINGESPEVRAQARKALGGLLATHAAAAGVLGLPMVTTLLAAASMIGGDDDEPWDAKVALQNMLADMLGQKPAEVLAHGLSRLTPWDISGRVGLDKLIFPDVQEGLEGQRLAESAMTAALGPVAGIGVNLLKGVQMMGEGRYAQGLEVMLPAALRGPVKALRYASEGVQDKSGISILDEVSPSAIAGQALGFSPSEARMAQEGKSAVVAQDRALGERRQELLTKVARAMMEKDPEATDEARKEIARFNEKNPARRITPPQIMQSVRSRQKRIDQAEDGVYLPRSRRDAVDVGRFANAD